MWWYKFPKNNKHLSQEIKVKVNNLIQLEKDKWYNILDDCSINKELYEGLIKKIDDGTLKQDELNVTISNKKDLEGLIINQENELLRMLNEPVDMTDRQKNLEKAKLLSGQGFINIRPAKRSSPSNQGQNNKPIEEKK